MEKKCSKCKNVKDLNLFYKDSSSLDGYRTNCKDCQNKSRDTWAKNNKEKLAQMAKVYRQREDVKARRNIGQHEWRKQNLDWELWNKAKTRSSNLNLPFDIERSDIVIPDKCPVLGIDLFITKKTLGDNSPTIDRFDPAKGYVKGNITVISAKANRIKNNATLEELEKVYNWYRKQKYDK